MTKEVIDALYEGEMTDHLGYEKHDRVDTGDKNARSGKGKKTVTTHLGEIE